MRKEFSAETPELILIISPKDEPPKLEKEFQKALDRTGTNFVVLSIYVAPADLKNLLKAIKLMYVKGIYISGKYQNNPKLFADIVPRGKKANIVVIKKNKYHASMIDEGGSKKALISNAIQLWTGKKIKPPAQHGT